MGFWGTLRAATVSAVNVKFLRFTWALTIALFVGLLTLGGIAGIAYILVTTCTQTCRSIPLALLSSQEEGVNKLSCVGFKSRALSLSVSVQEQSRQVFSTGQPSAPWMSFAWTTPGATLGKCSYQHAMTCGLQEWLSVYQGMKAIFSIANSTADISSADWPLAASTYYSSSNTNTSLDQQIAALTPLPARMSMAGAQHLLSVGAVSFAGNANVTIMEAPSTSACCDINTAGSKLGTFGGGSSRFVVNLLGRQGVGLSSTTCSTNSSSSQRCSWVDISMAMVLPPWDAINQKLCSEYYVQASSSYEVTADMSASICQMLGTDISSSSSSSSSGSGSSQPQAAPNQLCLNGTINQAKVPLTDFYSVSGACLPAPAVSTAAATAKPWAAQQLAATLLLLPLAHEFGASIAAYMPNAQVDVANAALGLNAIKNDNEAASWWMENYLYCCSETCNDWLSSIGSALGYEAYIEGAVAVIVILVYLLVFKNDRQRLGLSNLKGIADIAFEKQEAAAAAAAADGSNGSGGEAGGGASGVTTGGREADKEMKVAASSNNTGNRAAGKGGLQQGWNAAVPADNERIGVRQSSSRSDARLSQPLSSSSPGNNSVAVVSVWQD